MREDIPIRFHGIDVVSRNPLCRTFTPTASATSKILTKIDDPVVYKLCSGEGSEGG